MSSSRCGYVVLIALMALMVGCSSGGRAKESEQAVESLESIQAQLAKGTAQVERTKALLADLEKGTDLQKTFKSYTDAVADLKASGDGASKRAAAFKSKREDYMKKWEQEAGDIQNPAIKESSQQRRAMVRENFEKIASMGVDVRTAYEPYLKDVTDIQTALSVDLTPSGVQALKPAMAVARTNGDTLVAKMKALSDQLKILQGKISPTGK